jgi:hypothetical protein
MLPTIRSRAHADRCGLKSCRLLIEGNKRMRNSIIVGVFAIACASIGSTRAEVYPSRPIAMIVPFPPGSAFDVTARVLAEHMRLSLRQPVIVENPTGASGSIGTGRCARSVPDGYTLCFGGVSTHVLNAAVFALPYDVLKDFEPVSLIATAQLLIVAKKAMAANDLKELIAWLKANPGKASQGNGGPGSLTHIVFPGGDRHPVSLRSLSWRRCGDQRLGRRASRHHDRFGTEFAAACACRHDQGLCCHGQNTPASCARYPNGR